MLRKMLIPLTFGLFLLLHPCPAAAQQAATPACDGDVALVRISQIKPTSTLAAFMKAQDAHIAWYRKNGFTTNEIYTARIILTDPKTNVSKYSDNEVMTFHLRPPNAASGASVSSKDQAGWDAYVKLYRDSSDIKEEHVICIPKKR